jgi:hypothetical protein
MLRIALRAASRVGRTSVAARLPVQTFMPSVFVPQRRLFATETTETVIDVEPEKFVPKEAVASTPFENYEFQVC